MQPYFFPYLGYLSLLKHSDVFVLLDSVQFIRHGWIERNRILKQDAGWLYVKVPLVGHSRETPIKDVLIDRRYDWQSKLKAQLQVYKRRAPNYRAVSELVSGVVDQEETDLVSLNKRALEAVCAYLGITTPLQVFSQMGLQIETPTAADEWALNICRALGASEYWNPPGGRSFLDASKYEAAGIDLKIHSIRLEEYDQRRRPFEPALSIIDVLMFNSPTAVNRMLDDYELR
ncbi:MAG TPA: WbqC family protein [Solirubrobacteraceae bacterium]|nr:WbqC family protein [Solirubrobacteraceae bacterium]